MNTMLALLGLGGGELILLVFALLLCVGLPMILTASLIIYFVRRNGQKKNGLPPVPPPPASDKTKVMPRKCPQCGANLQPDAPEGLCPACLLQRGFGTEAGPPSGQSSFVPPPVDELAKLFPQLEILECLGRGGMGAVYKARQPRLDRLVALKILAPEKQNDLQFAERFEREARALARLNHPNIVTVFDFGEVSGRFYLLMEFVDGLTLRQLLQTGKIAPAEALNIVPKICEALQFAHEHGIVHRDIKPENILLDKQGRVKIADFGIAKIAGLEATDISLTGARDVMGTPHYMAPEQLEKPLTVDHRADIYSLGVVFYEMLTGELPLGKFAPPSQKVHVDVRLDEVVLHALEKEPARRYQHASQVKTAVETITGTPAEFAVAPAAAGSTAPPPLSGAMVTNASDKIILPAFLLAFFFGVFGAHRFYVGKIGTAIVQLFTLGGFGIWATIDWILLVCKAFTDGQGRTITRWIHHDPNATKLTARNQTSQLVAQPDRFWRNFAIVVAGVLLIPLMLAIFGGLAAIAIPNFVRARNHVHELAAHNFQKTNSVTAAETWSPLLAPGEKADFQKILEAAKAEMAAGDYEESLQRYLWYFIHSRDDAGQQGVRLSFALSDWIELGRHYPKAKEALVQIRDDDVREFSAGRGYGELFQEISRINQSLNDGPATLDLFKNLEQYDPPLATQCYYFVQDQLVQQGDYAKCLHYIGDPQARFDMIRDSWQRMKKWEDGLATQRQQQAARFQALAKTNSIFANMPVTAPPKFADKNFVNQTCELIEILVGADRQADAEKICSEATALLDDPRLKSAVADAREKIKNGNPAAAADKTAAPVAAAKQWLATIDRGNYAASWTNAPAIFQTGVSVVDWENSMKRFRQPLGAMQSRELKSAETATKLPGAADGQYVVLQFTTAFANQKSALETVTFVLGKDGAWKSAGYFIK